MEETKKEFKLPNEKVTVKFIPHKKGMASSVSKDHVIYGGMLNRAIKKFSAPRQRNGKIANILTKEEKDLLEKETGGDLSIYGDFWKEFYVTLRKSDASNRFDLSDPIDYISVRILESLKDKIAKNWKARKDKQTYQFAIVRDDEISNEEKSKLDVKKLAFKLYGKIEDDRERLIAVLRLLNNKTTAKSSKLTWIQGQVEKYVDKEPKKFVTVLNDSSFETKKLINEGIDAGYIVRKSNKYMTEDGMELCENGQTPSLNNAVKYLDKDKNQEIRNIIEAKVEENK